MTAPLYGLVLAGGESHRMGRPKERISYHGEPEYLRMLRLLAAVGLPAYLSVRNAWGIPGGVGTSGETAAGKRTVYTLNDPVNNRGSLAGSGPAIGVGHGPVQGPTPVPVIFDSPVGIGPAGGLCGAHRFAPDAAWLVLPCDMPLLTDVTVKQLLEARSAIGMGKARGGPAGPVSLITEGGIQPLCAVWEPSALNQLEAAVRRGQFGLRRLLNQIARVGRLRLVVPTRPHELVDVDTPEEREWAARQTAAPGVTPEQGGTL